MYYIIIIIIVLTLWPGKDPESYSKCPPFQGHGIPYVGNQEYLLQYLSPLADSLDHKTTPHSSCYRPGAKIRAHHPQVRDFYRGMYLSPPGHGVADPPWVGDRLGIGKPPGGSNWSREWWKHCCQRRWGHLVVRRAHCCNRSSCGCHKDRHQTASHWKWSSHLFWSI